MGVALHTACVNKAHPCLSCKLKVWRAEGHSPLRPTPEGWLDRPSVFQRERDEIAGAKAQGIEIERAPQ